MKTKSKFYIVYFSVVAVFVLLIAAFLIFLSGWLKSFEAAQPETMVNSIIENYIGGDDFYKINDIAPLSVSPYESKQNINKAVKAYFKDKKISYASTASRIKGCDLAYTIKADTQKIITVYFKKTADSSSLLTKYEIMSIAFDNSLYKSITVTMPQECEVKINGVLLKEKNAKTLSLPEIPKNYQSDKLKADLNVALDKMISTEHIIEATKNSEKLSVQKKDTDYRVVQNVPKDLSEKLSSFALDASKIYSAYMQKDAALEEINNFFATDTEFYVHLKTTLLTYVLEHESFRFEDVNLHSIHKFSDNLYSCHVSLTQVLVRYGTEYRDYYNKNVFICVEGDKMKVISLQSTEEK